MPAPSSGPLAAMTAVETKLFLRDPGAPITVVGIPIALLLVFGLMPGVREPSAEYGGRSALATVIAPISVAILLAMLALTLFPVVIATYREKGVLRRFAAGPVSPALLLTAQLIVNLLAAVVVLLLVLVLGAGALGMALPENPAGYALVAVLGTAALFSVGMLIAALARTARTAGGVGALAFFPMLALGGVWVPKEKLPVFLQHAADVLPLGGTLNGLRETAAGGSPQAIQLVALVVTALVFAGLSARFFRWQ
ncbi:multidrug ABC transporter permease [Amycolatopsis antarctica]|uniref:Transport permease protein n=1 Tax=Amycolatopsis antarctica TaxID=1854586 RepID=A0A263D123_9PSEU|nr:ABC transporter permease [Amycolatopsis antarctica]OZM72174.1 multidrug ABC transporter permease [Amycolatopsis antarctica]